jgi:hypothetical protein
MTKVDRIIAQINLKLDELEAALAQVDPLPKLQLLETRITALAGKLVAEVTEG